MIIINIILIFFVALSLSMDAFSLALAYGTLSFSKKEIFSLSTIVGTYHFFMPILGMVLGRYVNRLIQIGSDITIMIIFSFIGVNMIIDGIKKETKVKRMKLMDMLLFGLAVSMDSFSVGIGINSISSNYLLCSLIFSFASFSFTCFGLVLGKKLNSLIGKIATIIGGISLITLGIIYVL